VLEGVPFSGCEQPVDGDELRPRPPEMCNDLLARPPLDARRRRRAEWTSLGGRSDGKILPTVPALCSVVVEKLRNGRQDRRPVDDRGRRLVGGRCRDTNNTDERVGPGQQGDGASGRI
jgi:hypothetical protein